MATLNLLCAGAAQGLVVALQERFKASTGAVVHGRFGAVGAMKEALLAGAPCDVFIVTAAMIDALCAQGLLRSDGAATLGRVQTGIAVKSGQALPDISTPEALKAALLAADAIYFPDPLRATAGIHFAGVMRQLGIFESLRPRFYTTPNGAAAMRELRSAATPQPIGCTQVTEINFSPGVQIVAALPKPFELATVYSAAVSTRAANSDLALAFIALLAGAESQPLRAAAGFED